MFRSAPMAWGLTLALAGGLSPVMAQTAPRYSLQPLADLPGGFTTSQGMAINASGLVAGQSAATDGHFATVWAAPGRQPLSLGDLPGGATSSMAYGLNDAGTTVGSASTADGARGFRRASGGAMEELPDLPGGSNASAATAVNNSGVAVGYSYSSASGNNPVATLWSPGQAPVVLGDLPGGLYYSVAQAINTQGLVVGSSHGATGRRGFVWTPGAGLAELPNLGGSGWGDARGINDLGWVVGFNQAIGAGSAANHATLWREGQTIDLGSGNTQSEAYDVNNLGQVVGTNNNWASLWTADRQRHDLYRLVDNLPAGWTLMSAMSINDAGQITGWASDAAGTRVGYVLNPVSAVPEPATWALLLAGAVLGLGRRAGLSRLRPMGPR